ncbi:hypothetical protein ACWEV4_31155 [Streptomyces sp. NPDC003860]
MTTRRRLGTGPAPHPDAGHQEHNEVPAGDRIRAAVADIDDEPLYRPHVAVADLRARGVLGSPPPTSNRGHRPPRALS